MTTSLAFAQISLGQCDLANPQIAQPKFNGNGLSVTFSTVGPGSKSLPLTFSVQGYGRAALPVWFWVIPPLQQWAINGETAIPWPQRVTYTPPQSLGADFDGVEVVQGTASVALQYDNLLDDDVAALMNLYDPGAPLVTLTYLDEGGFWQQSLAIWEPPTWGTRQTIEHRGIALTFSHLQ
jgi:hypothetical protein